MIALACVLQYLEFCDDILVLEEGEVREAGNHQALMKANGRYAQLISNYQMEQLEVRASQNVFMNQIFTLALSFFKRRVLNGRISRKTSCNHRVLYCL